MHVASMIDAGYLHTSHMMSTAHSIATANNKK